MWCAPPELISPVRSLQSILLDAPICCPRLADHRSDSPAEQRTRSFIHLGCDLLCGELLACLDGHVVQGILEGEQERRGDDTLGDLWSDTCKT